MPIQIEFQIAGLIYILILSLAFFKKVKWDSLPNRIYKLLLLAVFIVLSSLYLFPARSGKTFIAFAAPAGIA